MDSGFDISGIISNYAENILEYLSRITINAKMYIEYIQIITDKKQMREHTHVLDDDLTYEVKIVVSDIDINVIIKNKSNFISKLKEIYNKYKSTYNIDNIEIAQDMDMLNIWFDISTANHTNTLDLNLGYIDKVYDIDFNYLPIELIIEGHKFTIDNYLAKGGQATIYEGNYIHNGDKTPVIFRQGQYFKIPDKIKHYFAQEYVIFDTSNGFPVTIMERLYPLIFSDKIFKQSIDFLDDIKKYNMAHGDATPNNIMMDANGNMKLIDYTPGRTYTKLYGKNDRLALSISLYEIKNHEHIHEYAIYLLDNISLEIEKMPDPKDILFTYISDMGNTNRHKFDEFNSEPDNMSILESLFMLQLLYSLHNILIEANEIIKNSNFNVNTYIKRTMDNDDPTHDMLDDLSEKHKIRYSLYKKDFIVWLFDNINNDKYDDTYLNYILNEINNQ